MRHRHQEGLIQELFVAWFRNQYPDAILTASVQEGAKSIGQAVRRKRHGYLAGTPDILVFYPQHPFHGMMIELKTDTGRASPEQNDLLNRLNKLGYYAVVAKGLDEAKRVAIKYMEAQ